MCVKTLQPGLQHDTCTVNEEVDRNNDFTLGVALSCAMAASICWDFASKSLLYALSPPILYLGGTSALSRAGEPPPPPLAAIEAPGLSCMCCSLLRVQIPNLLL